MPVFKRRRIYVPLEQLRDNSPEAVSQLSPTDLCRYIAGWREGTENHHVGMMVLRRREQSLARWALGVSVLSLGVSIAALFLKG